MSGFVAAVREGLPPTRWTSGMAMASRPSSFSSTLFDRFYAWANTTVTREPISDWTNTDTPTAVGFVARPVYGAMWAPMLVHNQEKLGLGSPKATALASVVFAEVHSLARDAPAGQPHCDGNGDRNCRLLDSWRSQYGAKSRD